MWKRPSIIPSIEDVKCAALGCGCVATIICDKPFDTFTLINRYKIPKKIVESVAWCNQQSINCHIIGVQHMLHLYSGLQEGFVLPDPVKSMQVFVILNRGQVDGD